LLAGLLGLTAQVVSLTRAHRELTAELIGEVEISPFMLRLQLYADKLYFAGQGANWELAQFYLEEIEETAEALIDQHVMEGDVDLSAVMESLLPDQITELRRAAEKRAGALPGPLPRALGGLQLLSQIHRPHLPGHPGALPPQPHQSELRGRRRRRVGRNDPGATCRAPTA
jgi:hypothetical protein